jgi:hypothetical protein
VNSLDEWYRQFKWVYWDVSGLVVAFIPSDLSLSFHAF